MEDLLDASGRLVAPAFQMPGEGKVKVFLILFLDYDATVSLFLPAAFPNLQRVCSTIMRSTWSLACRC